MGNNLSQVQRWDAQYLIKSKILLPCISQFTWVRFTFLSCWIWYFIRTIMFFKINSTTSCKYVETFWRTTSLLYLKFLLYRDKSPICEIWHWTFPNHSTSFKVVPPSWVVSLYKIVVTLTLGEGRRGTGYQSRK